ncbi:Uncharacterised protein [Mycobacteroides abscessus subsp. abscessus]|nr:Uncharacterised protein [Mycobacteroides abscessus subsp. abscessus]
MPADCSADRTATRSPGSLMISKDSPRSLTSSAPASSTAISTSSSDRPFFSRVTMPLRWTRCHGHPHLARRPVAVVGEALDEDRDAVGAVALVHDRLPVGAARLLTGAALARALDVVVGDRGLLRLLDGVVQRGVAFGITATRTCRHLDVLDQLREELPPLRVDRGLLVLGGGPFGVAAHSPTSFRSVARLECVRYPLGLRRPARCRRTSGVPAGHR